MPVLSVLFASQYVAAVMDVLIQIVLALESIERSRQLLADGQIREAFLISRQARDASGLSLPVNT